MNIKVFCLCVEKCEDGEGLLLFKELNNKTINALMLRNLF
jgi:hypothetical protein